MEMIPGEELSQRDLRERIFSNHISASRLRDALELLRTLGDVRLEKRETGGRPALVVIRQSSGTQLANDESDAEQSAASGAA